MKILILALTLAACVNAPPSAPDAAPTPHAVTWSPTGHSDSPGVLDPITCTEVISHPCPFLLYTTRLNVDGSTLTWSDATGGTDEAGVTAAQRPPVVETEGTALAREGSLVLAQRGDDGGLRHLAVLNPTPDGWEGDVSWTLFNVAGVTTFHVQINN